jgi:hypothetical protein
MNQRDNIKEGNKMENPYVDAVFEVFDEALDAIVDAKENAYMMGSNDLSWYAFEKEIVENLKGDFLMKLKAIDGE